MKHQEFLNKIKMNIKLKKIQTGFILKLVSRKSILEWSDDKILEGNADNIFIDLSSVKSSDDDTIIIDILEKYSSNLGKDDFRFFHQELMSFILNEIKDWKLIQQKLVMYYELFKVYLDDEDFEFWSRLKDDYQLREEGFTGCMNMPKELYDYFKTNNYDKSCSKTFW